MPWRTPDCSADSCVVSREPPVYGAPRVFLDLREAGETCSKPRVARLMRENGLRALHGYRTRRWSIGKPAVLIPNLLQRQCTVTRPNRVWVTDITYVRTWQGWLYVAVVMDLFSRAVAESFVSSLKKERIKKHIDKNRELAIADVADYIDTFDNQTRRHLFLGGVSPEQFEAAHTMRRQSVH